MTVLDVLRRSRIVPVVTVRSVDEIEPIARGLADGGVDCVEITLRTPHGLSAIRRIADERILEVGAGTVLDVDAVAVAADAGASFLVGPGFDEPVVEAAQALSLVALPGVATATELQRACLAGVDQVKLFPISTLGGVGLIDALHQPFADMSFMPSGGVTPSNAPEFLRHRAVFAVGCGWLVPRARGDDLYSLVRAAAEDSVRTLRDGG